MYPLKEVVNNRVNKHIAQLKHSFATFINLHGRNAMNNREHQCNANMLSTQQQALKTHHVHLNDANTIR